MRQAEIAPPILGHDTFTPDKSLEVTNTDRAVVKIDDEIKQLHKAAYVENAPELPDFSKEISALKQLAHVAIKDHLKKPQTYYELLARYAYMDPLVYAPLAFGHPRHKAKRKELVDGIYGMNVHIIQHILTFLDEKDRSRTGNMRWGVLNEHTMLALFNRRQDPNTIALPSTLKEDRYQKTDLVYRYLEDNTPGRTNIQVKSSAKALNEDSKPQKGTAVAADAAGNYRHRPDLSHAIVAELYTGKLTERQANIIKNAEQYALKRLHSAER